MVKHENHTPTGSFKARGGLTYVDMLGRSGPLRLALLRPRAAPASPLALGLWVVVDAAERLP